MDFMAVNMKMITEGPSTLKTKAASSSETVVNKYQTKGRHHSEIVIFIVSAM
jgi:hypothetical protein